MAAPPSLLLLPMLSAGIADGPEAQSGESDGAEGSKRK